MRLLRSGFLLRGVVCGAACFFISMLLSGCGGQQTPAQRALAEGRLILVNGAEPKDLDPHVVTGFPEHQIIRALMEGLVAEHPTESGGVEPGVAERWVHNADYSEWTFFLRTDAVWSNGDPVTASDFEYAYRRLLNPDFGALYASMLYPLKNAEAFNKGTITDWDQVGVYAENDYTLRFELRGPTPYLLQTLLHYTWYPIHRPTVEQFDAFDERGTWWTRPGNFVGNGGFVLKEWRPNQRLVVTRSPSYWDRESITLNTIEFLPISDRQTASRAFEGGLVHKTDSTPFNRRDYYRKNEPELLREDPFFNTGYLGFNLRNKPLDDVRVRRALAMAIDVERLISQVTKNGAAAQGFVPPGIEGYPYEEWMHYDPEAARRLLADAGYPSGKGMRELEYITVNADTSMVTAEVFQSMWRDELGVEIVIVNKEWQVFMDDLNNNHFDIFSLSWIGDYIDPYTFLHIMMSEDGNNRTGYASETYDRLIEEAQQIGDPQLRYQKLAQAEAVLLADMPVVPVTWANRMYLLHPGVKHWHSKLLSDQPYKHVRLQAD